MPTTGHASHGGMNSELSRSMGREGWYRGASQPELPHSEVGSGGVRGADWDPHPPISLASSTVECESSRQPESHSKV